ncbi:FHA domain-containing protein [Nocardia sp. NPDC005978]|uniref:FHA domain-containing protein n=1 Tax=Nocardia sp. NPDC005978 TaxID=3156725 RepID=UPI0033BCE3E9
MGRIPTTVGLLRGEGLIARFGSVVIYLAGTSPSTERILGAAETAAGSADPGVAIAQRLAATVFSGGSAQPPSFGVVAPTQGGILVLLRGPVRALVEGPEGTRQFSGVRAMTWADEILRDPVRRLTIAADSTSGGEVPHTNLRVGVVPGGGFLLHAPPSGLPAQRGNTGSTPRAAASDAAAEPMPEGPRDARADLASARPGPVAADSPGTGGSLPRVNSPGPLPDPTRRAPLPTPSHTRFPGPGSPARPPGNRGPDAGGPDSGPLPTRADPHGSAAAPTTHDAPPPSYPGSGARPESPGGRRPADSGSHSQPRPGGAGAGKRHPEPPETQAAGAFGRPAELPDAPAGRSADRRADADRPAEPPETRGAPRERPSRPASGPIGRAESVVPQPDRSGAQEPARSDRPLDPSDPQSAIPTETRVVPKIDGDADVPEGLTVPDSDPSRGNQPQARPRLSKDASAEANSAGAAARRPGGPEPTRPDPADQPPTAAFDAEAAAAEPAATERAGGRDPVPPETSALGPVGGALTTADGAIYPLDRPYVIGRDPLIDESVRRAASSPIVIPRDRHVSRVHAYVFIENGIVLIRDAATPGGTYVAAPGAQDWIRVGQRPHELKPGWSLRIGARILTYRPEQPRR